MAETVEFRSNGNMASGYLAAPESGKGPGVLVIQEWWGLDSGIKANADRLAAAGFVALAPDLYHGELAAHDEMDKAAHLMQSLPADRAAKDMSGRLLHGRHAVVSDRCGPG
jgi:carboxymethylenebutenolidase